MPVVIGALGSIPLKFKEYINQVGIKYTWQMLQKFVLLGTATASILWKVLSKFLVLA